MYFLVLTDNGLFSWQLKKNDSTPIAQGTQTYDSLANAMVDIESIKKWAESAEVIISIIPPGMGP